MSCPGVVVFQIERFLLRLQVEALSTKLKGLGINLGAGPIRRYEDLLLGREIVNIDINPSYRPEMVADAQKLPIKDNSVNFVLCTQVLGDVENPLEPIFEIRRVLKPGGYLLLTESQTCEEHDQPLDFWRFTKYGLEKLCEKGGLRVVEVLQRGGFYSTITQLIIRYLIDKLNLYNRRSLAKLFNKVFRLIGRFTMKLDYLDQSFPNKRHALGWCLLAQK